MHLETNLKIIKIKQNNIIKEIHMYRFLIVYQNFVIPT